MSTHTPGPWRSHVYSARSGSRGFWIQALPSGWNATITYISPGIDMGSSDRDEATCEANARLIAAAPELLEALFHFVAKCPMCMAGEECLDNDCFRGRTAIAKAE